MVGPPDRDLSARREEALARLAVTNQALGVLEEALRSEPGLPEDTAQVLLAGARSLCPVAASTGAELSVSAAPDHLWTVSVRNDAAGPQLRVRRRRLDAAAGPTAVAPARATEVPTPDVAVRLADLLRTGPFDDGGLR